MKLEVPLAVEQARWPVFVVDSTGMVRRANAAATTTFGLPAESTAPPFSLTSIWAKENTTNPEQFLAYWELSGTPASAVKLRLKSGQAMQYQALICSFTRENQKFFLFQIPPDAAPAPLEPNTPSTETSTVHRQKLDCALQLARTVSLDFNNALTSILGHTSLVLSKMEPTHPWRGSLLEVEKSAARAAEIANDLGTFSRQDKEPRAQAAGNLNLVLKRSVQFFQQNADSVSVAWALQFERGLFEAKFDEAKMQQVFIKILENAIQAIQAEGRITIVSRNLELTDATQDRNVRLAPGAYVSVEISDNGQGIKPEILPRIFEPFFTTKKGEKHRGLGLAWVYGIVTNLRGGVAISSQPGTGTSVRIYLPAEKAIVKDEILSADDLSGTQTILMVDDEDLLLTMGQTILSAFGYRVLTANSGQRALDVLAQEDGAIDLVITDLVMPSMSGRELIEHIQRLSPATRILCTSGYVWPAGQENRMPYLQKPFTSQELLLRVKQAVTAGA